MSTVTNPNKLTEQDDAESLSQQAPPQEDIDSGIDKLQEHANQRPAVDPESARELRGLKKREDFYQPQGLDDQQGGLLDKMRRRKRSLIGGTVATALVGGGFGIFSFLQAPFQFIHLAQILNKPLEAVTDFTDNRGWKLIEYARTRDNPNRRNLGYLGDKFADKYEANLRRSGMELDFTGPDGRQRRSIQGFIIDPDTREGQTVIQRMRAKGVDPSEFIAVGDGSGRVRINLRGTGGAKRSRQIISAATEAININNVAAVVSRRVLIYRAGTDWHRLKNKVRERGQNVTDFWREIRNEDAERIRTGANLDRRSTKGTQEDTDGDGTPDRNTDSVADQSNELIGQIENADTPEARRSIAGRLAGGGAALALAGAMCTVHDLSKGYEEYQHQNIDLVLERLGFAWSSTGSQVMSNIDTNVDETGAYNEPLFDKNAPVGERSVFSARPMQALTGSDLTGPDISPASRPSNSGEKPVLFAFADAIPGIGPSCGVRDQARKVPILGRILNTADAAGEFLINTGLKAFGLSMEDLIGALYNFFANGGVNVMAQGAELGTLLPHGMRLAAIDDFIGKGGRVLNGTEEASIERFYADLRQDEFETRTLWARLFDPREPQSFIAKSVLENPSMGDMNASYASLLGSPFKILPSIGNSFARISQPTAYAQSQVYDWGYNLAGYSVEELERISEDESLDNPYANAAFLEANNGQKIKEGNTKWGKCFGSTINPDTGEFKAGKTVNRNKLPRECRDTSTEFLRYRLYFADKQAELAYACYEGDDSSCNSIGFGANEIGGSPTSGGDGTCDPRTKSLGQVDGYSGGTPQKIQVCAIPNLSSGGQESNSSSPYYINGADGKAIVNADISKATFDMAGAAASDGVTLSAGSAFRSHAHQQSLCSNDTLCRNGDYTNVANPGTSNHQMGIAIDFDISKCPTRIGGNCAAPGEPEWDWLNVNAHKYGFKPYSEEAWHWSTTGN